MAQLTPTKTFAFVMQTTVAGRIHIIGVTFAGATVDEARATRDAARSSWCDAAPSAVWHEARMREIPASESGSY